MTESPFAVIDTFRVDSTGIPRLELHVQRTYEALKYFSAAGSVNREFLEHMYKQIAPRANPQRGRFAFIPNTWKVAKPTFENLLNAGKPVRLEFSQHKTQISEQGPQNFKTTNRIYWDESLRTKSAYADDVIGINTLGFVTETSRFNLFLKKNNVYYTPPLSSGCLDGVYRRSLILKSPILVEEKNFRPKDLNEFEIYVANSTREMLRAYLL